MNHNYKTSIDFYKAVISDLEKKGYKTPKRNYLVDGYKDWFYLERLYYSTTRVIKNKEENTDDWETNFCQTLNLILELTDSFFQSEQLTLTVLQFTNQIMQSALKISDGLISGYNFKDQADRFVFNKKKLTIALSISILNFINDNIFKTKSIGEVHNIASNALLFLRKHNYNEIDSEQISGDIILNEIRIFFSRYFNEIEDFNRDSVIFKGRAVLKKNWAAVKFNNIPQGNLFEKSEARSIKPMGIRENWNGNKAEFDKIIEELEDKLIILNGDKPEWLKTGTEFCAFLRALADLKKFNFRRIIPRTNLFGTCSVTFKLNFKFDTLTKINHINEKRIEVYKKIISNVIV